MQSQPFGGASVVTGVPVGPSSGSGGGSVNAFNDAQLQKAIEESQRGSKKVHVAAPAPAKPKVPVKREPTYEEQLAMVMAESKKTALYDFERRAERLKVPSEPEEGAAGSAHMFFRIGEHTIKRRFWSDNSLNNVYDFIQCHTLVFETFGADNLQLVNMTTYPASILDLTMDGPRTLQACELWPSGQLSIQRQGDDPKKALPPQVNKMATPGPD